MGRRVQALGTITVTVLLVALAGIALGEPEGEPEEEPIMCPPITIEDLFGEETSTTTTEDPQASSTTTTAPEPTTTTTVASSSTSTTVGASTSTTSAGSTTTSESSTTTEASSTASSTTTGEPADGSTSTTSSTVPPEPPCDTPFVYPMVYPVLGAGDWISGFGAPRDGGRRHHLGNDIAAPKLQPVVAVADGTVTRIAGDTGISGYRVHVRHDDGWTSLYIHLNNDTAGTDDGNGVGIRLDLEEGDAVEAGQIIGWNGDSGNAENTVPHLHFELRDPEGTPIDPAASLEAATRLPETPFEGPFADVAAGEEPTALMLLLSRGVPVWCDDFAATACPDDAMTDVDMAGWLNGLAGDLDLSPAGAGDRETVLTRAEIARALAWGRLRDGYDKRMAWLEMGIPDSRWSTPPPAPPDHPHQLSLERTHEILGGGRRCLALPDAERPLNRTQAAEILLLYLGWTDVPHCPANDLNR